MMLIWTLGVSARGLPYFAQKYATDVAVDKEHAKEQINGKIFDNSDAGTNMEAPDPHEHLYDTVHLHCLFGGRAKIEVVSWSNPVAPSLKKNVFS